MNQALENLTVRNLQLEAEVANLKAERIRIRSQLNYARPQIYLQKKNVELKVALDRAEEIAEMWRGDIQKWSQQWQVAESRLRGAESRNTEMQRKHKAGMRTEKNLAHANGWAAGFEAAEASGFKRNSVGIFEEIRQMHRSELCEVEKALKAQYLRLRREDPMVYMVKMCQRYSTASYMTRCPSHGFLQFFAQDLKHSALRLFSSRKDAKIACDSSIVTGNRWKTITYEVVEMPKQDIYSLPCYLYYHTYEAFQPLG
jgi:ribosomal protein L29